MEQDWYCVGAAYQPFISIVREKDYVTSSAVTLPTYKT
jgi:hypothetical protein